MEGATTAGIMAAITGIMAAIIMVTTITMEDGERDWG
jgi:hypothetical protein